MSRSVLDVHRSLARYVASILPDFDVWSIRTEPQEGRPYAVVKPIQIPAMRTGPVQVVDISQPFIVYIYPDIGDTAIDGQQRKLEIEEALYQAFFVEHPHRVPLWDYTGISHDQPGPVQQSVSARLPSGAPAGHDWARVREYQINAAQDAMDERRWSLTLTLRLAWRRYGKLISAVPVEHVTTPTAPNVH